MTSAVASILRVLKWVLSLLALIAIGVTAAMTEGAFNVSPATTTLVMAIAGLFGYFGISPFKLTAQISKALTGGWYLMTATVGWHAAHVTAVLNPHPHLWHALGAVAIVVGVLSRGPLNPSPPSLAAAEEKTPKPPKV